MQVTFIHTADWQIGKPYGSVTDEAKKFLLRQERITAIKRIGEVAQKSGAKFVLVAGDLFDSTRPSNENISLVCSAIGHLKIPVYVIPGNHDSGGPGGVWELDFFKKEKERLAPNLIIIQEQETPVELDEIIIFPCPLLRRHETSDLTFWLRNSDMTEWQNSKKPRIILAHGTVQGFSGNEEDDETPANYLDFEKIDMSIFDYAALGDWHGTKKINDKVWYSGTHEIDRFIKGSDHNPGNILVVKVQRNVKPEVEIHATGKIKWNTSNYEFNSDENFEHFKNQIDELLSTRVQEDVLKLTLTGALGLEALKKLEELIERLSAVLIDLRLENKVRVSPNKEELEALTVQNNSPMIANVASQLLDMINKNNQESDLANIALRELYLIIKK